MNEISNLRKTAISRLKDTLKFTGFILTVISSISYLIIVAIMIYGFEVKISQGALLTFLILGALDGVLIATSLRIQGIDFAKSEEDAIKVLKEYHDLLGKQDVVKLKPMWVHMLVNLLSDIFIKGGSIVLTLYFSFEIIVQGLGDSKYFFLGLVNVIMYLGFGFLSLAKSYDYYLENHIPYLQQKIEKIKGGNKNELSENTERNGLERVQELTRTRTSEIDGQVDKRD